MPRLRTHSFDLQSTLHEVKKSHCSSCRTPKIGVMGCIVNGPGEMADADYGYVGAGPGRVSGIYRGKECVVKNIPAAEALPALLGLIGRGSAGCGHKIALIQRNKITTIIPYNLIS